MSTTKRRVAYSCVQGTSILANSQPKDSSCTARRKALLQQQQQQQASSLLQAAIWQSLIPPKTALHVPDLGRRRAAATGTPVAVTAVHPTSFRSLCTEAAPKGRRALPRMCGHLPAPARPSARSGPGHREPTTCWVDSAWMAAQESLTVSEVGVARAALLDSEEHAR